MFAVIKSQEKKSIKSIKVEIVEEKNVGYYIFSVRNKEKINWAKLKILLGDIKTRVIFLDDIIPPHESNIKPHQSERYAHKMAVNALAKILQNVKAELGDKSAMLVDIHCKYQAYADVLVEHFKQVKIITAKTNFYNNYSNAKLYELGATVSIAQKPGKNLDGFSLIVSPGGVIFPCMEKTALPIVTALPVGHKLNTEVYHSFYEHPTQPAINVAKRTSRLDDKPFQERIMGALYECCGERKLGQSPIGCYKNEIRIGIEDINLF